MLMFLLLQVVMKIIKHARETPLESAQGPLLGMHGYAIISYSLTPTRKGLAKLDTLEVTNCFPVPSQLADAVDDGTAGIAYPLSLHHDDRGVCHHVDAVLQRARNGLPSSRLVPGKALPSPPPAIC